MTEPDFLHGFAAPARRALVSAGYSTPTRLTAATERDLLRLHGIGPTAIRRLRDTLARRGLSLAD